MTRATLYKAHEKHTKQTCLVNFISATTFCMTLLKHRLSFIKLLYVITKIMSSQFLFKEVLEHFRIALTKLLLLTSTP